MKRVVPFAALWLVLLGWCRADEPPPKPANAQTVLRGLRDFYAKTARPDGSFQWNRPTTVAVLNIATGEQVGQLKHPGEVLCLAVSADGKTIAAGGGDKTVSVWTGAP